MSFLSSLATAVAVLLTTFGVDLNSVAGIDMPVPTEMSTTEVTAAPAETAAASEAPTGAVLPSIAPADGMVSDLVTREQAQSDAQTLLTRMCASVMSGNPYAAPDFVADAPGTRIAARWSEYMSARTGGADDTRIVAFSRPGVAPKFKTMYSLGGELVVELDCTISLKTASGGDAVSTFTLSLGYVDKGGARSITSIGMAGDAGFDALKSAVGDAQDAAAIDAAIDAAIAALKA
ncbi:MAG: hypothetical protein ACOYIH_05710 [Candidatus Fimadaptatus sp.]|jgi:hypothetical protein